MTTFVRKFYSMRFKYVYISLLFVLLASFTSCSEYSKILKSTDVMFKLDAAKKYFAEGKYDKAATLFEDVVPALRGSAYGEEALYMLAQSYYSQKDYITSTEYFRSYYNAYPKGEFTELARYYAAYGLYLESPDPRFDQIDTYTAMQYFQEFLDYYPQSEKRADAQNALFELQEKLALKELMAARLYYNLGEYILFPFPGGNYLSCIITSQAAIRTYPYSQYKEEFLYYIFKSKYEIAVKSVEEKKDVRYRDVIDEYYNYMNEFPQGGVYSNEIKSLYTNIQKELN
ncbi:outer membrane protein assembly factor BamD [Dysgonomonadaceae bacterium PH5-43]|nr:outer membrane protein assembly factor BamD [Dysgonomonadaceae bacterium PH5-43]